MTTLYLKYRPQRISELDLADVRELLLRIVNSGDIPHAFLFEGPRGSGKTSAARIIAKVLNCENPEKDLEPCNKCSQCLSITKGTNIDVVELDAASHRGIDDVRLIRESVKLSPAKAKKKVYIIDEAHMLTTEASNALLKTLEEPPDHVVFILATTNPEKLLDTIKSRTIRVNFKKATASEIVNSLTSVLEKEKIKFREGVLDLIAGNVDGSFRDAKKILEELIIKDVLNNLDDAQNYLLNKSDFDIDAFFKVMKGKDLKKSIHILNNAESAGIPSKIIYTRIINKLKAYLFSVTGYVNDPTNVFEKKEVMVLSDIFITFWNRYQNDVSDYIPFYLSSVKWCESNKNGEEVRNTTTKSKINGMDGEENGGKKTSGKNTSTSREGVKGGEITSQPKVAGDGHMSDKINNGETNGDSIEFLPSAATSISDIVWKQVLSTIRGINASTEALLRAAKPLNYDGKILSLGVFYKFHKEKLESIPHRICLEDVLRSALGQDVKVQCFLTQSDIAKKESDVMVNGNSYGGQENLNGNSGVVLSESDDGSNLMKLVDEVFGS